MKDFTQLVAVVAVLASLGCGSHTCPRLEETRLVDGDVSLLGERETIHVGNSSYEALSIDDACANGDRGCIRIGATKDSGLTFRAPPGAGSYALRDLGAQVCVAELDGSPNRCRDAQGTLDVRDVASDRLDAELVLEVPGDARPAASGSAHLVAFDETVEETCGGGGCIRMAPME